MTLKKSVLVFLSVSFLVSAKAQHNELSYHLSPQILSGTKLEVNSPILSETRQFGGMGGINFTRLSQSDLGIRFGLNLGILRSKFATPNGAYPKIWGPMIGYSSLSIEGVKNLRSANQHLKFLAAAI
jgi:hypothetical protein